ncbi:DUF1631 family protein [Noviherbaspirillum aridicola]|uniref:DUF1631 family protein n=1 Tax=Noviherbaspirillum aridicola TaxID=2849687 RepID=A0ABQ4Q2U7_9BURK|nr:DUF1631 family protein [Noviherbaspirillum aridicola]GIZ51356.1 hypothetical protein NCCP691_13700 [Noviherbaspirillum aridicola]
MSGDRLSLLNTLAFTAVRLAAAEFEPFTERLLLALAQPAAEDDGLRAKIAQRLRDHTPAFHQLLRDSLQEELLQAVEAAAEQGRAAVRSGALDLSADSFDAMQRRVQAENLAQALDRVHADQLAILGMRITHWLWPDELRTIANPFRGLSFVNAVVEAWAKFEREPGSLAVFMAQLRPALFLPLGMLYEALNRELAVRGVLPDAEQRYQSEIPELTIAVTPSTRDLLQAWLAPEGTLKLIPAKADALLEAMFDRLANDERLPFRTRKPVALIAQALMPLLRNDSDFFFGEDHPARRFLAALFDVALASSDGDALSQQIAALPERVSSAALPQLEAGLRQALAALDQANAELLTAQKTEALRQEAGAAALSAAEADIASRLETGEVDPLLEDFLRRQWVQVLSFARRVSDSKPELLPAVTGLMDELIGSLQPKQGAQERRQMVERLPSLVSTLNSWMNVIKWQGPEREEFFAALAERHAAALRPGDARQALEQRMETVSRASEHQLDRRASEQQAAADAAYLPVVHELAPGAWVELVRNDGSPVNCRLCWISPARSRLVFIVPQTKRVFMLRTEELARALRAERASPVRVGTWAGDALEAALQDLRD